MRSRRTSTAIIISAANLVNLLLARGTGRVAEMAVLSAIGARRARLVRQLLIEGSVLGAVAAAMVWR